MKIPLVCFAVCLSLGTNGQDIRLVDNVKVDLQPIRDWLADTNSAKRPLPHWKQIQVVELIDGKGAWPRVSILVDGKIRNVYLNNAPRTLLEAFADKQRVDQEIDRMKQHIAAEKVRVRNLRANAPSVAPTSSAGGRQIHEVNIASADLATAEETLQANYRKYLELEQRIQLHGKDFAMNTGRKYAGLEVWDCGRRLAPR